MSDDLLTDVLSEFARTLVTDFPIQSILDRLVTRIVEIMPVSGAGVTLISPDLQPRHVAASDPAALRFEQLQSELAEGPCLTAYTSGRLVSVPDVSAATPFPRFATAARFVGLVAVFTFPLRHGETRLGALDLYRDVPGPLAAADLRAAQTLADVAAAYVTNAQIREEAHASSERFRTLSLHDALTGLPNRALLYQRLEHAALRASRDHAPVAVLFADIDQFKHVNDTHGHSVGDELLQAVAARLTALVRPGDTLARVSGDEFVFLCEDLTLDTDAMTFAHRIEVAFRQPFMLSGTTLTISVSVGIAIAGTSEEVTPQLLVDADVAMYQVKAHGGAGHQVFDLHAATRAKARDSLQRDLAVAVLRDELSVSYQPIVDSTDGTIVGAEALLRWKHPERGDVPAPTIIEIAEQDSLIDDIGTWVLRRSLRDHSRWRGPADSAPLLVSVNVSGRQLLDPHFTRTVARLLAEHGTDPDSVVLELTETATLTDPARALAALADLKALGVRLALDDFGTGYSSLSYLRRLPVDIVKIDQSFIADVERAPIAATAIMGAISGLAHALGMSVIAEGVETALQRDQVLAMGCECSQGFFYARPVPTAELELLVAGAHLP